MNAIAPGAAFDITPQIGGLLRFSLEGDAVLHSHPMAQIELRKSVSGRIAD
ncbi:hypothetical protein [Leisingera sp. S232]|uniref:hypothetical protein n=1 Tax=Leisingera sp. S232 TaxID=3415132 RepID=UPI003C7C7ADA